MHTGPMASTILTRKEAQQLREHMYPDASGGRQNVPWLAREIGIDERTLTRVLAFLPVQNGNIALVRAYLEKVKP